VAQKRITSIITLVWVPNFATDVSLSNILLFQSNRSQSHVANDGHSVNASWCRDIFGARGHIFDSILTVTVSLLGSVLSDEKTGLSLGKSHGNLFKFIIFTILYVHIT
jgi:hypothetical protein